ncbi:MAG: hypothetical protein QOK40_1185 [Miltoncostaeaceae bacterium]|jgi:hypothetical protein|nr:hypothetical protein [Miltoncostaeaceae bacterium]
MRTDAAVRLAGEDLDDARALCWNAIVAAVQRIELHEGHPRPELLDQLRRLNGCAWRLAYVETERSLPLREVDLLVLADAAAQEVRGVQDNRENAWDPDDAARGAVVEERAKRVLRALEG